MSGNPYQSAEAGTPPVTGKPSFSPLRVLLALVVIFGVVFALLMPVTRSARPAANRNQCLNNTKGIMLALLHYQDEHGTLPPAYTVDEQGNRLHSWRALILPYMEGDRTHELVDYTKPWDHPANAKARESVVEEYLCPSVEEGDEHLTTYLAVVGPECVFTGPNGRAVADIPGGLSTTIAIVDAPHEKAVHWMSPEDITLDEVLAINEETDTQHPSVYIAGFLDGHADPVELQIDRAALRAMLTVADDAPTE